MDDPSFTDLTTQFFSTVRNNQINLFFSNLKDNLELQNQFRSICHSNYLLQEYLKSKNACFSVHELNQYVTNCIRQSLSLREVRQRENWISTNPGPSHVRSINSNTPFTLRHLYSPKYILDRQTIFNGNCILLRNVPALSSLINHIRNLLISRFECNNLSLLHTMLNYEDFVRISKDAYHELRSDLHIPKHICSIASQLGIDPDDILWEWPSFRIFYPSSINPCGSYKGNTSKSLDPHRDTWFGAPQHQINFWGPIQPLGESSSLRIYPKYHNVPISNSSHIWDVWAPSYLAVPPRLLESVQSSFYFAPDMEVNETLVFSSHSLHSSPPQEANLTRVTFEFRIIHKLDKDLPSLPPNIDYLGLGHLFKNFFNSSGIETNYYDSLPL